MIDIDEQITEWETRIEDMILEMDHWIKHEVFILPPSAVVNWKPFAAEFNVMTQSIRDAYDKYPKIGSHKIREV